MTHLLLGTRVHTGLGVFKTVVTAEHRKFCLFILLLAKEDRLARLSARSSLFTMSAPSLPVPVTLTPSPDAFLTLIA